MIPYTIANVACGVVTVMIRDTSQTPDVQAIAPVAYSPNSSLNALCFKKASVFLTWHLQTVNDIGKMVNSLKRNTFFSHFRTINVRYKNTALCDALAYLH